MNIIKNLENRNINIRKIGILGSIWIFILHILSDFLMIPIYIIKEIFSVNSSAVYFYTESIYGLMVKIIMVKWLLKMYSTKEEVIEKEGISISKKYYIYTIFIILVFRIVFDNSIGVFVDQVPVNESIEEAFNELFKYPILAMISVCIVAPIYEEIIYRGIILKGLSIKYNDNLAVIVSALLFAVMHMNLHQGINAFFLGLVFGYLYLKTKSLYITIFAHFINNGIGIIVSVILTELVKLSHHVIIAHSVVTVIGLICIYKIIIWFRNNEIILNKDIKSLST